MESIAPSLPASPIINQTDSSGFSFSRARWFSLFHQTNYHALSEEFIRGLDYYYKNPLSNLSVGQLAALNDFLENFLFFFCSHEFKLPKPHIQKFMGYHPLIANLVALSDFKTTTAWVTRLSRSKENYFKLLVLYNSRTEVEINPALFFDVNQFFASEWWTYFWLSPPAFCVRETYEKIRDHLSTIDPRLQNIGANTRGSYFPVTYVAPELEHVLKTHMNRLVAGAFSNVKIRDKPQRNKIALITDRWYRSAVYTSLSPLIRSLTGHYEITLVHFGRDENTILDRDLFARTICIQMKNSQMDLSALQDNGFSAVIYPDIGMNAESIYLANVRIAPVQVMMYGHPASTWGSKIDYFIGGKAVEDLSKALENYGERLVVIPGMGVSPVFPDGFIPSPAVEDEFIINCAWTGQKVSYPLLEALQEIIRKAERRVVFHVFAGGAVAQYNGIIPFARDLQTMLGREQVRVYADLPQKTYLDELCKGRISLDSYPFGGFNTVIDALSCKKPIVVWETGRAYSRFGSTTLSIAGIPELIARSREEYIALTVRLINDDGFRKAMTGKVAAIDLKAAFAKHENPDYFRKAVDFLIENHGRLAIEGSRDPIVIE
jgi:hypothetical protein